MEQMEELINQKKYDVLQECLEKEIFNKIITLINEKNPRIKYTGIFDLERATKLYLDEKYQYIIKKVYDIQNDNNLLIEEKVNVLLDLYKKISH